MNHETHLIISVDTEEEGLWSAGFKATGNTVKNIEGIPEFQSICNNHNLKPVYLCNSPIVEDKRARSILQPILDAGNCEIGTHIHPWNTEPVDEFATAASSYLCNLHESVQASKLERVTLDIENYFGIRPSSFRAGRYGLDDTGAKILKNLGYEVDSSVCPFMDYSEDGGPNFEDYPWWPYYVGAELSVPSPTATSLIEIPVAFGFNWRNYRRAFAVHEALAKGVGGKFRLRGIADRTGVLKKLKFSPEKHCAKELKKLADVYIAKDIPCMVMMLHSSSLKPGYSPYVADEQGLQKFLACIDETIEHCLSHLAMRATTFREYAAIFRANNSSVNSARST